MGQYFKAVNISKKEYVCPWCVGQVAKLWEWSANPHGSIFTLLLRKSSEGGGGDFHGPTYEQDKNAIPGRWAGDHVCLVGDYDESRIWDHIDGYRNISKELVEPWNNFIEIPAMKLTFEECNSCGEARMRVFQTNKTASTQPVAA